MNGEQMGKMTAYKGGTFFNNRVSLKFSTNAEICDEFLLTVFGVYRGLVLYGMNLRFSYAYQEALCAASLAVKESISYSKWGFRYT
jgi:hypothetical protein